MSANLPVVETAKESRVKKAGNKRRGSSAWSNFFRDPRATVGFGLFMVFVVLAVFAPVIAPYNPEAVQFLPLLPPSHAHLFGTTSLGQDVFSQFVWGARTTTTVGIGAGLLSTLIAIVIGVTGGYKGGKTDLILNTISNIFLVLPGLALLIIIESYVRSQSPYTNGLIIGITGWAWGARVMRSMAMTVGSRDYIAAARLAGASTFRIIYAEILPNMTSVIASNIMYTCLGAILAESGLAYLGFEGMTSTSWGAILYLASANSAMLLGTWWWFVPPGIGIALLGLSFALMNFGVDQVTNPRLRRSKRTKAMRLALKQLQERRG